jgi:hypothetical protein
MNYRFRSYPALFFTGFQNAKSTSVTDPVRFLLLDLDLRSEIRAKLFPDPRPRIQPIFSESLVTIFCITNTSILCHWLKSFSVPVPLQKIE